MSQAQITLDFDFDHGSLDAANSSVNGSMVQLAGRDNFNSGDWKWLYFSADNVNGMTPTFQIDDDFATGGSNLNNHEMVYSYDQQTWQFFDNNNRSSGQNTFTFSNNTAFTQNQVYVAYGLPYSYGRMTSHTSQLVSSPWVSPTGSGNSSLVIGQSPGGTDDLGRAIAARDMFGYKITDSSVTGPKQKIAVISGVHSNETLGNYTLEGLVNFLTGDDFEAAQLRRQAEFYVYPMANPDGRFAGYNRSTVQQESDDPNRFWDSPLYGFMSDIKEVGDALLADTGGDVDYFIDFHSTVVGKDGHYAFVHPDFQSDPFWLNLLQLDPSVSTRNASLVSLTAAKFGRDELNAEFSITFETQFIGGENIDRFHDLGNDVGLAFNQVFRVFADLNFDGQLDEQDWLQFIAGAETDLSGLSSIDAYSAGDLDGDGVNSIVDFGLFKDAFVATHGLAGFVELLAPIPEPSTTTLLLIALASMPRQTFVRNN
ncbi:MAG: M14-type cytosolic carboxypeptidase [Bythopirellula sp.]